MKRGKRTFESAEVLRTAAGRQYHIGLGPGDAAPYVLLCGDPARARRCAAKFAKVTVEKANREYLTLTGEWKGIPVSVIATGMGPDNTEIALVELSQIGRPTLLRIGSCGALQPEIPIGSIVVSSGAVRLENTSTYYVPEGFPSVAHLEASLALLQAAQDLKLTAAYGLTATAPGFYGAQAREVPGFPPRWPSLDADLAKIGVLNLEMEASALFTLASLGRMRAGCACAVFANRPANRFIDEDAKHRAEDDVIAVGLRAVEILARMDKARGKAPVWLPEMGLR
ncbi:MAG: nucleoside phosphorylase [Planctomycetes bacterium]|nr:nucleoside phosphorylase [Planctomycetota bacterium]